MSEQDIQQIEISLESAKKTVELMEAYGRLIDNKDFKHLIQETYFKTHAARLVMLRGDSNISKELQDNILKEIDAIGFFRTFLRDVVQMGNQAKYEMAANEDTLSELLEEDV